MSKVLRITRASAIFAVAFFGSFGMMFLIPRPEPIVLICWLILMIVWAIAIRWWIVAGLLTGILFSGSSFPDTLVSIAFGVLCGLAIETAIWTSRKPSGFWRNFFLPE